jgi:peptide chain release factor subunit 1
MDSISADTAAAQPPPFPQGQAGALGESPSQKVIDRLTGFEPTDLPVVSMYMAFDPADRKSIRAEADSMLHELRSVSKDRSLAHEARVSLRQDIERTEELFGDNPPIQRAMAIFACSGADLFEVVALPRALRTRLTVNGRPSVGPMLAVLQEYERLLAVVVERHGAHAWEIYLGAERDAGRVKGPDLRRFGAAGRRASSPQHHEDKGERVERTFFKDLAGALEHLSYDVLAFGGHEPELSHLMEALPRPVSERTIGTFAIDPSTATAAEVRERAQALLDEHDRERQRRRVDGVTEAVAAGAHAALGLEDCLWGASTAAVQTLLVEEGARVPGVVCDESRWLARSGDICPLCGSETRHTNDVIEELVEAVIDAGGSIYHIAVDTPLRKHLTGAELRFPLPPRSDASAP